MREKEIEQKLVREVKRRGGICPKFVSPGANGMPDRIVFLREVHGLCRGEVARQKAASIAGKKAQRPQKAGVQGICDR